MPPSTDRKFQPTDEHLIEKNKEELDEANYSAKKAPLPGQDHGKFADIDKDDKAIRPGSDKDADR